MSLFRYIILALSLSALMAWGSPSDDPSAWVSLYNGNERNFSPAIMSKITDLLSAYGVDFQFDPDKRAILISRNNRSQVQQLLAKTFTLSPKFNP